MTNSEATNPDVIDRTVDKTNAWLRDIDEQLGGLGRDQALRALRAFFHTLRDRLPPDVAADFAAQLPTLLRGVYYEAYKPADVPMTYNRDGFVDRVASEANLAGPTEAITSIQAVTRVVRGQADPSALDDAARALPNELADLLTEQP